MMPEAKAMLPRGVRKALEDLVLGQNFKPILQMPFYTLIKLHSTKVASTDAELIFKQHKPETPCLI